MRSQIITHLQDVLRGDGVDIACSSVHSQLLNFVNKNGRMEAGVGHDDDVIALAIGLKNIGIGTIMAASYREPFIPPDIRRLMEQESDREERLAMRF